MAGKQKDARNHKGDTNRNRPAHADLNRQNRQQPDGGPGKGHTQNPFDKAHPAAGLRQKSGDFGPGGNREIRNGKSDTQKGEYPENVKAASGQRETDRRAQERGRTRGCQQGCEHAGQEMTAKVASGLFARGDGIIGGIAELSRAVDFKQAPHIEGKQGDDDGHHGQEQGLLELDAPANRAARKLDADQDSGDQPEGGDDARRTGKEAAPGGTALRTLGLHRRHDLDREDRQDAGHEIQDKAAQKGQRADQPQAGGGDAGAGNGVAAAGGRAGWGSGDLAVLFDGKGACNDGDDHVIANRGLTVFQAIDRDLELLCAGCALGCGRDRHAKAKADIAFDQDFNRIGRGLIKARDGDIQKCFVLFARCVDRLPDIGDRHWQVITAKRDAGCEFFDVMGKAADGGVIAIRAARKVCRDIKGKVGLCGDADIAADQIIDIKFDMGGLCGIGHGDINRQDDVILVAECFEAKDRKTVRGGPADFAVADIG